MVDGRDVFAGTHSSDGPPARVTYSGAPHTRPVQPLLLSFVPPRHTLPAIRRAVVPALAVAGFALVVTSCGGDTYGVATTVVNVTPTNFATIPPVSSTAPGTTTTLPENAVGEGTTYTVQAGDSPIAVANRYNISVSALLAYNGIVDASQFPYPGQTIKIPPNGVVNPGATNTTTPTGGGTPVNPALAGCGTRAAGTYKVASGDSLYSIRKKFCVSLSALLSANNWADAGSVVILPGQTINIPAAGA